MLHSKLQSVKKISHADVRRKCPTNAFKLYYKTETNLLHQQLFFKEDKVFLENQ